MQVVLKFICTADVFSLLGLHEHKPDNFMNIRNHGPFGDVNLRRNWQVVDQTEVNNLARHECSNRGTLAFFPSCGESVRLKNGRCPGHMTWAV